MKVKAKVQLLLDFSVSGRGSGAEGLLPIPTKLSIDLELPDEWNEEIKRSVQHALELTGEAPCETRTIHAIILTIRPTSFGLEQRELSNSKYPVINLGVAT